MDLNTQHKQKTDLQTEYHHYFNNAKRLQYIKIDSQE